MWNRNQDLTKSSFNVVILFELTLSNSLAVCCYNRLNNRLEYPSYALKFTDWKPWPKVTRSEFIRRTAKWLFLKFSHAFHV